MAFDRTRTVRGALAGSDRRGGLARLRSRSTSACSASTTTTPSCSAASSPAAAPRRRPSAPRCTSQNGALFGALYAQLAPSLPVPRPCAARSSRLLEHLATWPAIALVEPSLLRSGRAFAQSAWRHLLFGAVLGELERRLNPPAAELEPVDEAAVASNGHGSAEHLVATGRS